MLAHDHNDYPSEPREQHAPLQRPRAARTQRERSRAGSPPKQFPNARVIDCHDVGNQPSDGFVSSGIHRTAAAAGPDYTQLILEHLKARYGPMTSTLRSLR